MVFSVFSLSYINKKFSSDAIVKEPFILIKKGTKMIKYHSIKYIIIKHKKTNFEKIYYIEDMESYSINEIIYIATKEGFFGFRYISYIEPSPYSDFTK